MAGCFCKDNKECIFDVRNGCEMMRRCLMDESSQVGRIISSGIGGMMSFGDGGPFIHLPLKMIQ